MEKARKVGRGILFNLFQPPPPGGGGYRHTTKEGVKAKNIFCLLSSRRRSPKPAPSNCNKGCCVSSCVLEFGTNRFAFGEGKRLDACGPTDRRPSSVLCPKLIIPGRKRGEGGGRLRIGRVPICAHLCETRGQAFWGESSHSRLQWPQSVGGGK